MSEDVLARVLGLLEEMGIPFMLVGSFASNYYGEPRSTHDADVVIQTTTEGAGRIEAALGEDFIVGDGRAAVARGEQFNAIHVATSFKVDFWPLRDDPFDQHAFLRRRPVVLFGRQACLPTAEDLILQKLRWAKETESAQQRHDVEAIIRGQEGRLDWEYLRLWADRLSVRGSLEALRVH